MTIRPHLRITPGADRTGLIALAAALDRDAGAGPEFADLFLGRPADDRSLALSASGALGAEGVLGVAFGSLEDGRGYVDLFAVAGGSRRRGVATRLLDELEAELVRRGARRLYVGGHGGRYAWPGVDAEYVGAMALLEGRGYVRTGAAHNMEVDLSSRPAEEVALGRGVVVRRAAPSDWPALRRLILGEFDAGWVDEVGRAMRRDVPGVFVALRGGEIVGFAAHGVNRSGWFGPMGTRSDQRGSGIGAALLRAALGDMRDSGTTVAQISWVGPTGFYARTVGARVGRQFVLFAKDVR